MKYAVIAARVLMGLVFLISGANKILHFAPMPAGPVDATTWMTIMFASKWLVFVAVLEIIGSILLLVGRYVPLGLTLLGPIVVNILLFHLTLDRKGLPVGIACLVLETFLVFVYRRNFAGVFEASPVPVQ